MSEEASTSALAIEGRRQWSELLCWPKVAACPDYFYSKRFIYLHFWTCIHV